MVAIRTARIVLLAMAPLLELVLKGGEEVEGFEGREIVEIGGA